MRDLSAVLSFRTISPSCGNPVGWTEGARVRTAMLSAGTGRPGGGRREGGGRGGAGGAWAGVSGGAGLEELAADVEGNVFAVDDALDEAEVRGEDPWGRKGGAERSKGQSRGPRELPAPPESWRRQGQVRGGWARAEGVLLDEDAVAVEGDARLALGEAREAELNVGRRDVERSLHRQWRVCPAAAAGVEPSGRTAHACGRAPGGGEGARGCPGGGGVRPHVKCSLKAGGCLSPEMKV